MKKEPVLIILAGLAALVGLGLEMTTALHVTDLAQAQIGAVTGFVAAVCALVGTAIRAAVVSPATFEAAQDKAPVTHTVNVVGGDAKSITEEVIRQVRGAR